MRRTARLASLGFLAFMLPASASSLATAYSAKAARAILPANAAKPQTVSLSQVSCVSAGNCTAVGTYKDNAGHADGPLLSEVNGQWATGVEASPPANASSGVFLNSVSCTSPGNCSAVGTYDDQDGNVSGLLLTEADGTWAQGVEATLPPNAATNQQTVLLPSVSCTAPGTCVAVGQYMLGPNSRRGLLLTETAGTWADGVEPPLPGNSNTPVGLLVSVSCPSTGNCGAAGSGDLVTEAGGTWTSTEVTLPANGTNGTEELNSISCASAGNCTAVGSYKTGAPAYEGLLVTETAGTWATGVEAAMPANASSGGNGPLIALGSVSCASAGNCTAIGTYKAKGGDPMLYHGLLLTETSGQWAAGVDASLPVDASTTSGQAVQILSVSCSSPGNCSAAGAYNAGPSSISEGVLLAQSRGSWARATRAPLPYDAAGNPEAGLASIACTSPEACTAVGSYSGDNGREGAMVVTAPQCVVPRVVGKGLARAKRLIAMADCVVGKVTKEASRKVPTGHVISQTPAAGKHLPAGSRVNLVVSK